MLVTAIALSGCGGGNTQGVSPAPISALGAGAHHNLKRESVYNATCNPLPGQVAGTITEYTVPTASSEPWGVAVDANGTVWVAEYAASIIASFAPNTQTWTSYATLTKNAQPRDVAIGPDGNPWYIDFNSHHIGTIDNGAVTEYTLPVSDPEGITVESATQANAGIWVALNGNGGAGAIDNVSTSGTSTDISEPASEAPVGISADSSGDIWYTSFAGSSIVEHTASGTAQTYKVAANSEPWTITEGPPGTGMWFTELVGNKIGNVTATGAVNVYNIPTASSNPLGIVAACGNIWFAENAASKIGELDPSTGTITEYVIPTSHSGPVRLTTDNNGNVWFSEENSDKIAEIMTSTSTATATPSPPPTPTPSPTPTPTPTPAPGPLTVYPTSVTIGVGQQTYVSADQSNGIVTTDSGTCGSSGDAIIGNTYDGPGEYEVSVTGSRAGTCSFSILGSGNQVQVVSVTVN